MTAAPDPIYLDHSATTPVDPEVLEEMLPTFGRAFGNASSRGHRFGWDASDAVELARARVARLLDASPDELFFTSGATESNFAALLGVAGAAPAGRRHLVSSPLEHKSVLAAFEALERQGFEVTWVPPADGGVTRAEDVLAAVRPDTLLVSVMWVNNEIGVINPIPELGRAVRARFADVIVHSDATQAFGKLAIDVEAAGVDVVTASAHKLYGPKGVGVTWIRRGAQDRVAPVMRGGGQERGMRGGTLNVSGIVGFGKACELARARMAGDLARLAPLSDRLFTRIAEGFPAVVRNGTAGARAAWIVSLTFPGVRGDALVKELADRVAVSSGAACAAGGSDVSHVLRGMGLPVELARSTLRFSLGRGTTAADVDRASEAVLGAIDALAARAHDHEGPRADVVPGGPAAVVTPGAAPTAPPPAALAVQPIGVVVNGFDTPDYIEWRSTRSRLVLDPAWVDALDGLEGYSHVMVVSWMHHVSTCKITHVPQGRFRDVPEVGIFACRCPYRPNPLAVSTVRLIAREGLELLVEGLDAVNGTPVVDIKPYTPPMDAPVGEVRVPEWVDRLVY